MCALYIPVRRTFLLTRLIRGVTRCQHRGSSALSFLLTRLIRGVTGYVATATDLYYISTHTPHTRRDINASHTCGNRKFLLTRLIRGVTTGAGVGRNGLTFLLTRLIRGVTDENLSRHEQAFISTHTPHTRRDSCWAYC